jgi:hypothetical protein
MIMPGLVREHMTEPRHAKSQPSPPELRLEDLVFGLEILDHCLLLLVNPAGKYDHQKMHR